MLEKEVKFRFTTTQNHQQFRFMTIPNRPQFRFIPNRSQFRFMITQNRPRAKISIHDPLSLTSRLRHAVRNLPPEVLPLIVVVTASVGGGTFAMLHKLWTDQQLRRFPAFNHKE